MSGHSRWTTGLRPMDRLDWIEVREASPKVLAETRAWVQGYILALEDAIKDLVERQQRILKEQDYPDPFNILSELGDKIQESLDSAYQTLSTLHDVIEGTEEETQ